jgi:outer membrane protein
VKVYPRTKIVLWLILCPFFLTLKASAAPASDAPFTIQSLYMKALDVSPAVMAAKQKLEEARAKIAETSAMHRPQLNFSGTVSGASGQVASPVSSQTYGTVEGTVSLPLPNSGRLSALSHQSDYQFQAASAALKRVRIDLARQVSDAYFGVLRARDASAIAAENLAQAERQVADTQKRVDAGEVPSADILKAQVPLAQDRVILARANANQKQAEQILNSLLMRPLDSSMELEPPPTVLPLTLTREQVVSLALQNSPDVLEAEANRKSSQAAIGFAHHLNDPDWAVQTTHTRTSDITAYSSLTTLMLSVTVPLSDGGVAHQQVRQAQLQEDQANSALTLARQQVRLEAMQAYLEVQAAQATVTGTTETLRLAEQSLLKAQQAYEAGLTSTLDVLASQLALAQARTDANSAVYDLAAARARLDQAIGKEVAP